MKPTEKQLINYLPAKIANYQDEINRVLKRVVSSGWFVLGPEVKTFEQHFAKFVGVKHCVGVANGTDAIELGLKAVGIMPQDLVATVANAGFYTSAAIAAMNARPHFMDVDADSFCVTLEQVIKSIKAGAKCVVVTHLYGLAVPEISEIAAVCKAEKVALLEDCAQAHGAIVSDKRVGSFGDVASFSFYPTKNLGGLGDGGALVTNDPKIHTLIEQLRQYGWSKKYEVDVPGGRNSRLDEIQAAILSLFLPTLDKNNNLRRTAANYYRSNIVHPKIETPSATGGNYVAHLYVIKVTERDSLRKHLDKLGIQTEIHYPLPDHFQSVFTGQSTGSLPNTEALMKLVLTLPCYPEMDQTQVERVVSAVNQWKA